ncbi:MAG: dienelactone hydrolase family protein [Bdellovibrionota bacterium]
MGGQEADAVLFAPAAGGPHPGVILYSDIVGPRPAYEGKAERLAKEGFAVLLPNIFYRAGRPPLFSSPVQFGEEKTTARIQQLREALTPANQLADAPVYVEFLSARKEVRPGPLGFVVYCFSGGLAVRTAAACPNRIKAAASFHGGNLYTDQPDSPHGLLPKIKAALYFGHAEEDKTMPAAAIEKLEEALRAWGGKFESHTYEGAHHGWTTTDFPIYNRPQADRAFAALVKLLRESL